MSRGLKRVHIVISDNGWILERLAHEIASRLDYVGFDTVPDPAADIQYYITYGSRQARVSQHELALFTHLEQRQDAADRFFAVAGAVDYSVAQSRATEEILRAAGHQNVRTISPGVDHTRFRPRLKIGVVGRTYHTGRKGEALVQSVMDIPDIDWHFTGDGWPGASQFVPEAELPNFYRTLDYVLIPALVEGGPMCALEALACGCPIISSNVGWVPEFPHREFRNGDANDLRRVLLQALQEKQDLASSVAAYSWTAWAENHNTLFGEILGENLRETAGPIVQVLPEPPHSSAIVVHGSEVGSKGGPTTRAPRTAVMLRRLGVDAKFIAGRDFSAEQFDVVHVLNIWHPAECELLLRQVQKSNRPLVISPIYLDLREKQAYETPLHLLPKVGTDSVGVEFAYSAARDRLAAAQLPDAKQYEPIPDYIRMVSKLLSRADHLIFLSRHEESLLREQGIEHPSTSIVPNPVALELYTGADPAMFAEEFGISDYVLCVGRVEARKNQLALIEALRDTDIPLVFVGEQQTTPYVSLLSKIDAPNVHFIGRLPPGSQMLASAYAGAKVFCLPSWSEGAPLVALEAAAAGCNMVLSDRSSEREYFGDLARYCDPADLASVREAVLAAYGEGRVYEKSAALIDLVSREHSWEIHAQRTLDAYRSAVANHAQIESLPLDRAKTLFVDLTTSAHRDGPPSGIARTEDRLAIELSDSLGSRVQFILWNSHFRRFLPISRAWLENGAYKNLRSSAAEPFMTDWNNKLPYAQIPFSPGDVIVLFGGAWIRNGAYLQDLLTTKRAMKVGLISTIYDVIQWKFEKWFPEGVGEDFSNNCARVLEYSDRILTCSQCSADDIREFALAVRAPLPPIDVFRLGDTAASIDPAAELDVDVVSRFRDSRFVLYVSALDVRKNHTLLFSLWRRLVSDYGERAPHLIMVGSKGWGAEDIVKQLATDGIASTRVHILHGINDMTLNWLYVNCMFTVYPSLYEGWGLPVAESLRYGKFCLSSNAGSLPEIAPELVELLDPMDFKGWYEALQSYCFTPAYLAARTTKAKTYEPYSWAESASTVADALAHDLAPEALTPLAMGESITFGLVEGGTRSPGAEYQLGGWSGIERDGCWTIGSVASLGMRLDAPASVGVALVIRARAFMPGDTQPQRVRCTINNTVVTNLIVGSQAQQLHIPIYRELLGDTKDLIVALEIEDPRAPAKYSETTDGRLLGLRVLDMTLEPIFHTKLNIWSDVLKHDNGIPMRRPAQGNAPVYLGLDVLVDGPCQAAITLDGISVGRLIFTGQEHELRAIKLMSSENGSLEHCMLGVRSEGFGRVTVRRVGFFDRVPREIIQSLQTETVVVMAAPRRQEAGVPAPMVDLNTLLEFNTTSRLTTGLAGGWHPPESDGTWSDGRPSTAHMRLRGDLQDKLRLTIRYVSYDWLAGEDAAMTVIVGRAQVSMLPANALSVSTETIEVETDLAIDALNIMRVTFSGPPGIAPIMVAEGGDQRRLSFRIFSIEIRTVATAEMERMEQVGATAPLPAMAALPPMEAPSFLTLLPGTPVSFAEGGNIRDALWEDWHAPEASMVWGEWWRSHAEPPAALGQGGTGSPPHRHDAVSRCVVRWPSGSPLLAGRGRDRPDDSGRRQLASRNADPVGATNYDCRRISPADDRERQGRQPDGYRRRCRRPNPIVCTAGDRFRSGAGGHSRYSGGRGCHRSPY